MQTALFLFSASGRIRGQVALETHASMLVLVECDALDFAALALQ